MAGNEFNWPKHEDFTVLSDAGKTVGHIRIKPSGILWRPKGQHSWHGVTLEQFADFAVADGKSQTK